MAVAIALLVAGCAGKPPDPAAQGSRYASQTLADLESVEIQVEQGNISEQASVKQALESYKQAVQLTTDPQQRVESLRRMADLVMSATSAQEGQEAASTGEEVAADPSRLSEEAEVKLDREVDIMLFQSFMQGATEAKTQDEMYQMLDLAGGILPELDGTGVAANYETAIQLYKTVIARSQDDTEKAEAYYMLAKAYDIAGKADESRETLKELSRLYPGSNYYLEAQFRLAEAYFSEGEHDLAIMAYSEVVHAGDKTAFFEQATYKRGWSYYKVSEYGKALDDFMGLIDLLEQSLAANTATKQPTGMTSRMLDDTYRVASLSFNNLDGVKGVTAWFARTGPKLYEHKQYRALGDVYRRLDRYVDAAEAYDAFVTLYPDSDLAPSFSSAGIQALQDGGFPTQVLPAKEKFVLAYGIDSAYWRDHETQRVQYLPLLKSHLLDLAKHYHAVAQRETDGTATFLVAAGWYRQLMQTDPADTAIATINHLYAEALYSGQQYAMAATEFDRTAYSHNGYEKASEAAYFGLVSRQALVDQLTGSSDQAAALRRSVDEKITAGLRFAATFPAHEKAPNVLQNVIEDQLAGKDIASAVKTAGMLVSLDPAPAPDILKYGWETLANGEYDLGRYAISEFAYTKVLAFENLKPDERKNLRERMAASIYKQGEQLAAEGKQQEAAGQFMRVGVAVPEASIRAAAEFDAANIYLKLEQWALAIPVLEQFRRQYPGHELTETIPDKLALAYEKTGNWIAAAKEMEFIHDKNQKTQPELARAALWQAAELLEKAQDDSGTLRLYGRYVSLHPTPLEPRMEAQYRMLKMHEKRNDTKNRDLLLNALNTGARTAGSEATPRVNYLGAFAIFTLTEPVFARFTAYKLKAPLKASLGEKRKLMQAALDAYSTIGKLGVAEYVTAAQYRTAEVYRILAADLMASERPKGLGELELEQYDLLLEEQALPFEDKAIGLYTINANLVQQDIYDDWVKKSIHALSILQPGRYAKKEQAEDYVEIVY